MIFVCGPQDNEKTVDLQIPLEKRIGFMLSSGADSAILLYMICKSLMAEGRSPAKELKYIFTIPKVDGAEDHSTQIVDWINKNLNLCYYDWRLTQSRVLVCSEYDACCKYTSWNIKEEL